MYILNIGLNNNPFSFDQICEDLNNEYQLSGPVTKALGQWDDNPEPTLVAYVEECNKGFIETLCRRYTQECIAVWDIEFGDGWLVYEQTFKGEKFQFDRDFFLM
tara:strand:+ start:1347 stop:1658 length:312 start_codon:yes stop_codon:yes gene_type:complete